MRLDKLNYRSMTYRLSNKGTKTYFKRTILIQVIVEELVACFTWRHGVFLTFLNDRALDYYTEHDTVAYI